MRTASTLKKPIPLALLALGTLACSAMLEDDTDTSDDFLAASVPTTIRAVDMETKTTGAQQGSVWNLWSNGYLATRVSFPTSGSYRFDVAAFGSPFGGLWPNMQLRIDGMAIANLTVSSSTLTTYTTSANVTAGIHAVAIAFTNDAVNSREDRNLFVDRLGISSVGRCGSTPEPQPQPQPQPEPQPQPSGFDVKAFLTNEVPGLPYEGNPSGVPPSYSWAFAATDPPVLSAPPGTEWVNWWSVAGVDQTETRPGNTRVEFRGAKLLVLPTGSNTWVTYFVGSPIGGGGFQADFSGECTYGGVTIGTGALTVNPQARCLDHFWPTNPAFVQVGGSIRAAIAIGSVRLVLANPSGPDDRGSSHFIIAMGSDWRTSSGGGCPTNQFGQLACQGVGGGRFIYPRNQWRAAVMSTMTADDLRTLPMPPAEAFRLPDGTFPTP